MPVTPFLTAMDEESIGQLFQERTKHRRSSMEGRTLDWTSKPLIYKTYPRAPAISLSSPSMRTASFDEALKRRRSVRTFSGEALSLDELSFLLWAATGVRESRGGHDFRTAPSAGALYPIGTYVVVNYVTDLAPGLYHYGIKEHRLELLREGRLGEEISRAALEQDMCAAASAVFIWTAIFERSRWKYGQRAYRYVYLDAGHIAANLALAATSVRLGSCQIAAAYDDEVNSFLGVDGTEESVLYLSAVGRPR
jgi:SagB-type dehydrogenase family enzyme